MCLFRHYPLSLYDHARRRNGQLAQMSQVAASFLPLELQRQREH